MKITGELLKSERINLKLNVQDVALSLKLSSKIINAIESGNLEALPVKTFVRGFVKSYAQLLKLDADVVLMQFQEEMGSTNPLPKVPPPRPTINENNIKAARPALKQTSKTYSAKNTHQTPVIKDENNSKNIALMISAAIILIVVLVVSNKIISSSENTPVATVAQTTSPMVVDVNPMPAALDSTLASTPSSDATSVTTAIDRDLNATTLENGFEKSNGKPVEILLEAKKDTELFYAKGNSQQLISLKLVANQIQVLRSSVGLYLKVTDGTAVKISVDGASRGFAGSTNKEVKLTF